jgi:hypothetical protein
MAAELGLSMNLTFVLKNGAYREFCCADYALRLAVG